MASPKVSHPLVNPTASLRTSRRTVSLMASRRMASLRTVSLRTVSRLMASRQKSQPAVSCEMTFTCSSG